MHETCNTFDFQHQYKSIVKCLYTGSVSKRQLLENFSFATVDKSIIQTVLPVIWQSVHRPRFRHLQLFILNSNKLSVTKRHINIYQLQTFKSSVTKSTSELISTNHLRCSSWVQGLSVVTFSVK